MVVKLITTEKNPQMCKKKNILSASVYKQTHQNETYYPDMEKVKYCIEMHLLENHNRRKKQQRNAIILHTCKHMMETENIEKSTTKK